MTVTIYHNSRCSKSRQTLQLLWDQGHEPVVVEYLKTPPDQKQLDELLVRLGMTPIEIMRTNEQEYREAKDNIQSMTPAEQTGWLAAHPRVLQRPIVVSGTQAAIGRPPERVLEILP